MARCASSYYYWFDNITASIDGVIEYQKCFESNTIASCSPSADHLVPLLLQGAISVCILSIPITGQSLIVKSLNPLLINLIIFLSSHVVNFFMMQTSRLSVVDAFFHKES